jgi:F-type H+-transporting ATPase subunit a
MEKLHHELWIVQIFNTVFGPLVASALQALGFHVDPGHNVIPDHIVMIVVIVLFVTVLCLIARSRLKVENPSRFQIVLEDIVAMFVQLLQTNIGHKGPRYLPLIGTMGIFIFFANQMGKIPGLMSPTASLNTTVGCAITVWVYYHFQGIKEQGIVAYVKHFAVPPGAPALMAPIMLPIELISHLSRVMSLSLRLFGNIFGEEMVVLILASIVPFIAPLPMMVLGLVTGTLQAFIFVLLTMIYLAGAVHTDHDHEEHLDHTEEVAAHAAA